MTVAPYVEKPRNETMIEVEVDSRPLYQCLPDGAYAIRGKSVQRIYASSEKELMDLVETDTDSMVRAEAHNKRLFEEHLRGMGYTDMSAVPDDIKSKAEQEFPGSPEASFRELTRRDMKPLASARVLKREIPSPTEESHRKETAEILERIEPALSRIMATALKTAMAESRGSEQIKDVVSALAPELAASVATAVQNALRQNQNQNQNQGGRKG
jgi:hypothetical protein